ncbi:MAG: GPW/gp25 family protein [Bacteroidota bacterium]
MMIENNMNDNTFLGRGWAFPPRFDFISNIPTMVEEEEDIKESIRIILSTSPGERIMNPKFGCTLSLFVFDSIDSTFVNRVTDSVRTAILNYEPRVTLDEISVDTSESFEGIVYITLDYTIRKINVRGNIVYPFYIKEGTNVRNM